MKILHCSLLFEKHTTKWTKTRKIEGNQHSFYFGDDYSIYKTMFLIFSRPGGIQLK